MDRKMSPWGSKKRIFLSIILGALAFGGLSFGLRRPILLVSDPYFEDIYGAGRTRRSLILQSLQLWRRIKLVRAPEGEGLEMMAFSLEEAAKHPRCVVFPYRYLEEARLYAEKRPDIPTVLLAGEIRNLASEGNFRILKTDTETDYFRAGMIAAAFAESRNQEKGGTICFFQTPRVAQSDRDAFRRGLEEGGYGETPVFIGGQSDYAPPDTGGCAVVRSGAEQYLASQSPVPGILFSWVNPAYTPEKIRVIFDDSPWTQLSAVMKGLAEGGEFPEIPSKISFMTSRIADKALVKEITKVLREETPK